MPDVVREPAPAKLNPVLRVLGRRPDGFHEIETVVLPLTLADGVEARSASGLTLSVTGRLAREVPAGEENLVLVAARALAEAARIDRGAALLLAKQVPVAAGLGGGSADAAATMRALNVLWDLGWPPERLAEVSARVGSDVPALIAGGPMIARGRGDLVQPLSVPKTWWVLCPQDLAVSAADAYAWWDEAGGTGPALDEALDALLAGEPGRIARVLGNDLEEPVVRRHRQIADARDRVLAAGGLASVISGSGPTVAGLCRDARHAEELARATAGIVVASLTS